MSNKNYRCYFTDSGDRIRSFEPIECADDSAATLKVDELLATSRYGSAELWEGKRLVGRWSLNGHSHVEKQPRAVASDQGADGGDRNSAAKW
jgi:hypothetical protein